MIDASAPWRERRTFDAADYSPRSLLRAKAGRSLTVVLPARNEESTVGPIVAALREQLMEDVPLLDELLVLDSDSTDATARRAREAGARVVAQSSVLPELPPVPGKGEALWKSLHVTDGDLLAFIDADLREFDPRFAVGLFGPLLTDDVLYVKGCYDRPLLEGKSVVPAGGGRVTELVARPLLNLHWPELAGFVQPLAGEYAASRAVLEAIPFVSGYGVEIGMLIDVVERFGADALGQVDLGERIHRNSPDLSLARMAAQVNLTVHSRLQRYGRIVAAEQPSRHLTQFSRTEGRFVAATHEIENSERPPMREVPAYRARREARGPARDLALGPGPDQ